MGLPDYAQWERSVRPELYLTRVIELPLRELLSKGVGLCNSVPEYGFRQAYSLNDFLHPSLFSLQEGVKVGVEVNVESDILFGLHEEQLVALCVPAGQHHHFSAEVAARYHLQRVLPVIFKDNVEVVVVIDTADCLTHEVVQLELDCKLRQHELLAHHEL